MVSGLVLDQVTGLPVPNATLFLGELEYGTYSVSGKTIAQTVSDGAGRYSFDFTGTKGKDYAIIGKANHYFDTESITDYKLKEVEKSVTLNISLKPIATIKIHVKKTDMSYDSLIFSSSFGNGSGTYQSTFGKHVDTNLLYSHLVAGVNKDIYIYVEKYSAQTLISGTSYTNTIYLMPVDTTYINLNY